MDDAPVTRGFSSPSQMSPVSASSRKSSSKYPTYPSARSRSPIAIVRSRATRRCASVSRSGETSSPHQPPSYGVSSSNPTSSAISGPTRVPCRVITPSIASSRGSIRFITLIWFPAIFFSSRFQSCSRAMKNVVCPESPYGVWTTRSSPSPAPSASARSSRYVVPSPIAFGTEGTPASLPRRVVSIFESSRWRSAADGNATSSPSSPASSSVSSSNIRNAALPPPPRDATRSATSLWPSR